MSGGSHIRAIGSESGAEAHDESCDVGDEPLTLDAPIEETASDELLLDAPEPEPEPLIDEDLTGGRRWFGGAKAEPAPAARQGGGTLFERMSSIARGNAKAPSADDDADSDPLDIPRFLNRQNNQ